MAKYLFILVLLLFTSNCFSQTTVTGCDQFKTGKFAYRDSSGTISEIKRTAKTQTEYNPKTKLTLKYKIEWLSNCSYKLTQTWASSKEKRKFNGSWLTYNITSVVDNTYEYKCTCNDNSKVSGVVMKRE